MGLSVTNQIGIDLVIIEMQVIYSRLIVDCHTTLDPFHSFKVKHREIIKGLLLFRVEPAVKKHNAAHDPASMVHPLLGLTFEFWLFKPTLVDCIENMEVVET